MAISLDATHRPSPRLIQIEKWYVDVLLADESVLIVYLLWMRLAGFTTAQVTAEWSPASGPAQRTAVAARNVRRTADGLQFGAAEIRGPLLTVSTPQLSAALELTPRHGPVRLVDPVYSSRSTHIAWDVEIPDADVRGELVCEGIRRDVEGRGYRDHVSVRGWPWRFPLETLVWGRAYVGDEAAIWIETASHQGHQVATWRNGRLAATDAERPSLGDRRVLLDARIGLGPLLQWITPRAHQRRWLARASNGAEQGLAVHEEVRWR